MLYNYFTALRNLGIMQQIYAPLSLAAHLIGGFEDSGEGYRTGVSALRLNYDHLDGAGELKVPAKKVSTIERNLTS